MLRSPETAPVAWDVLPLDGEQEEGEGRGDEHERERERCKKEGKGGW